MGVSGGALGEGRGKTRISITKLKSSANTDHSEFSGVKASADGSKGLTTISATRYKRLSFLMEKSFRRHSDPRDFDRHWSRFQQILPAFGLGE